MDSNNLPSSSTSSPLQHKELTSRSGASAGKTYSTTSGNGDNLSTLSPNSDISLLSTEISAEKYQRLASEYAKLRSQFVVLKKGVIEQKAQNEELQEAIKQRDQAARRMQQETESLVFRNKQLTKRISVLQNDLEHTESGANQKRSFLFAGGDSNKNRTSSNASTNSSGPSVDVDLFDEINQELKSKVEENERLRELVRMLEEKRDEELQTVERKLKESELKAEQRIETLNGEVRSLSSLVSKSNSEKKSLEERLKECQQKLKDTTGSMENLKQENTELKNRVVVTEKQLQAAKQHARLQQARGPATLQSPASSSEPGVNGIPRSGSFSGIVRSSGSFSRGIPRSGSLSINHSGSPTLATLLSTQSQSTKDLTQNGATNQQASPSHSSNSYQDIAVRQRVITEFATKVSEITCALSTLHSHVSKKISILYALFNNNVNHLYFFDMAAFNEVSSKTACESNTNGVANRSEYIMNILRKFNDSLKLYDTHLIILEEAIHQFLSAKIRYHQQQQSDEAVNKKSSEPTSELSLIQQELTQHSNEIVEKFTDYINYLNKINPYMSLCLNLWCKTLQEYDPNNSAMVKAIGLDASVQAKLADTEKRNQLCQKQEQFAQSVTNSIRVIGQICSQVKLLLSKSLLNTNYLTVFNHFLHRINALEKTFDETKTLFTSKLALEHDLGITVESDLLAVDDALLSAMVFFRKSIIDVRLMLEMHYCFFVDNSSSAKNTGAANANNAGSQSTSPMAAISGQLIPEEDDEDDEADESDESGEENQEEQPSTVAVAPKSLSTVPVTSAPEPKSRALPRPHQAQSIAPQSTSLVTIVNAPIPPHDTASELRQFDKLLTDAHKELSHLKLEREQWILESEWNQLKLAEEQRKVAELEMRLQSVLTQLCSQPPQPKPTPSISQSQWNNQIHAGVHQQQSLRRANSNSNSLASSKSLDANNAELGSISSAASLQSPTLDCFGTVSYPAINDQSSVSLSVDGIVSDLAKVGSGKVANGAPNSASSEQQSPPEPAQAQSIDYLQQKMTKLINTLQVVDSRAAALQQECNAIHARYQQLNKEKEEADARLVNQDHSMAQVQEEYQTSVENYEFQLRTMSEHLAELNEKLAAQREEIDILKYQQQQQQQQQSGKTSSASNMAKTFRRNFKK